MSGRWVVTVLAVAVLCGCVSDQSTTPTMTAQPAGPPPRAGYGRLIILREPGYVAMAIGWDVKMDGQPFVEIKNGTFATADVPAGRHQLTTTSFAFPGTTVRDITIIAGQTQFLQIKVSDRSNGITAAGMVAGLAGAAVIAAASANSDDAGPYAFVPLDEATGRRIMAELKPTG